MFRAAYLGLYTHVVTGRCQGWMGKFSHSALTTTGHHMGI